MLRMELSPFRFRPSPYTEFTSRAINGHKLRGEPAQAELDASPSLRCAKGWKLMAVDPLKKKRSERWPEVRLGFSDTSRRARLLPVRRQFPLHEVRGGNALLGGEPRPAPEEKEEDVTMAGKHKAERPGLPFQGVPVANASAIQATPGFAIPSKNGWRANGTRIIDARGGRVAFRSGPSALDVDGFAMPKTVTIWSHGWSFSPFSNIWTKV